MQTVKQKTVTGFNFVEGYVFCLSLVSPCRKQPNEHQKLQARSARLKSPLKTYIFQLIFQPHFQSLFLLKPKEKEKKNFMGCIHK